MPILTATVSPAPIAARRIFAQNACGHGLAARLYEGIEEAGRAMGLHSIVSIVTGENTGSVHFHEKNGILLRRKNRGGGPKIRVPPGYVFLSEAAVRSCAAIYPLWPQAFAKSFGIKKERTAFALAVAVLFFRNSYARMWSSMRVKIISSATRFFPPSGMIRSAFLRLGCTYCSCMGLTVSRY